MSSYNPYLPLTEYVPDAEPHVFGNRVYIYGSHDKEQGERFCMEDYVVYSADVNDLSNWTYHGVSYKKSQDPRSTKEKQVDYYAPDCVRGNDGKYYLYYFAAGPNTSAFGPMSVAVGERPEGPFSYIGDIQYHDGSPVLDFLTNDPAVINDDGRIWLYYGWGLGRDFRNPIMSPIYNSVLKKIGNRSYEEIKNTKPSILSCAVVELEDDMITVKGKPKAVLDSKTTASRDSMLYHHAFYEAASIRKIRGLYYLVYSSGENNELCYATSKYPDRDFTYGGGII
ncbi:MAG: family 43 glycosylhydrolase [Lachnospiraceae bacterium]|nr:family 43 glycosylhydrolase [Lachnospiraceae bacterium]